MNCRTGEVASSSPFFPTVPVCTWPWGNRERDTTQALGSAACRPRRGVAALPSLGAVLRGFRGKDRSCSPSRPSGSRSACSWTASRRSARRGSPHRGVARRRLTSSPVLTALCTHTGPAGHLTTTGIKERRQRRRPAGRAEPPKRCRVAPSPLLEADVGVKPRRPAAALLACNRPSPRAVARTDLTGSAAARDAPAAAGPAVSWCCRDHGGEGMGLGPPVSVRTLAG